MTFSSDSFASQDRTQVTGGSRSVEADFVPGDTIAGDYLVLAWIGAGGWARLSGAAHWAAKRICPENIGRDKITLHWPGEDSSKKPRR